MHNCPFISNCRWQSPNGRRLTFVNINNKNVTILIEPFLSLLPTPLSNLPHALYRIIFVYYIYIFVLLLLYIKILCFPERDYVPFIRGTCTCSLCFEISVVNWRNSPFMALFLVRPVFRG